MAVLAKDETAARSAAISAVALIREPWEPETTARNLRLIREARTRRAEPVPGWAEAIERDLEKRGGRG